ncbi:MAG: three-Cys-motif partner protein TcmP [Vallitaleaceae bacterium]|nr:three-Cys-motif partner protein TcmP [Vallitaleaceae bacterium]
MTHEHFDELRDWSERKHDLLMKYLGGFVRILGKSTGTVYYVDGFAGPGICSDGGLGSPTKAAKYAETLRNRNYQLRCIYVEEDQNNFQNLIETIEEYNVYATCLQGRFEDHLDTILSTISDNPTIFFLDPFGIKGIEWQCIQPVLNRKWITEILIRINPKDISRLAGHSDSTTKSAEAKRNVLTDLYGFDTSHEWEVIWKSEGTHGLVNLYTNQILRTLGDYRGKSYVCLYPIRSIEGILKYYLLFGTCHPKGATLMSRIIYKRERSYERDVLDYKEKINLSNPNRQLDMFDALDPTEEEIDDQITCF